MLVSRISITIHLFNVQHFIEILIYLFDQIENFEIVVVPCRRQSAFQCAQRKYREKKMYFHFDEFQILKLVLITE